VKIFNQILRQVLESPEDKELMEKELTVYFGHIIRDYEEEYRDEFISRIRGLWEELTEGAVRYDPEYVLVGYTLMFDDGDCFTAAPMFRVRDVLSMDDIGPWDRITFGSAKTGAQGLIDFYEMDDNAVIAALSCVHRIPRALSRSMGDPAGTLGCFAQPGISVPDFVSRVLSDCMHLELEPGELCEMPIDYTPDGEIPMPNLRAGNYDYLKENAMDEYSIVLRRTQLYSYLDLYQSLKNARDALKEEFLPKGRNNVLL